MTRARLVAGGVVAVGLALWAHGLSPAPAREWLAQTAWVVVWLLCVERTYAALLAARTPPSAGTNRAAGTIRSPRDAAVLIGLGALLVPLSVVAETCAQWVANHALYDPGDAVPTYLGLLRGLIDTRSVAALLSTTAEPLSVFTRGVLGWHDEVNPFALVMCAAMFGNVLWAVLATAIGSGSLRREAPVAARAFRMAGLQAATAPLFTLAYFLMRGGDGLNVWSGVLHVLSGTIDAGEQVPTWVRITGVAIFFLLPPLVVAWRLRADRRALGSRPALAPATRLRAPDAGLAPWIDARMRTGAVMLPLLALWALHLGAGPFSWAGQTVWLALWLVYLRACIGGVTALSPGARAAAPAWSAVAAAWPLAVGGAVVQVGTQWLVALLVGEAHVAPRFYGWFLGQALPPGGETGLPTTVLAAAFLGNALWASVLLRLAQRARREHRPTTRQTLELGALQAATAPLALCAYMLLTIITRDRAAPGMPRYDVWHVWTYVARAATGASFASEAVPAWLRLASAGLLLGLPLAIGAASAAGSRRARRFAAGSVSTGHEALPASAGADHHPARPPEPIPRRAAGA